MASINATWVRNAVKQQENIDPTDNGTNASTADSKDTVELSKVAAFASVLVVGSLTDVDVVRGKH